MRTLLRWVLRLLFRFRAFNVAALNTPGPVLLVPNHVSWFDWLLLAVCLDGDWRFVTSSVTARASWLHRWIMVNRYTFPIDTASPYAVKKMAEFLENKGRLVLFAEGRISRTGTLMKIFDGTGFLLFKTRAKVITAYLRGARHLPGSPNPCSKSWFSEVTVHFSPALQPPVLAHTSTTEARLQLTRWVWDRLIEQQFEVEMQQGPADLYSAVAETARRVPGKVLLEDYTGQKLSGRKLMIGAELLARELHPRLTDKPARVGVLLPNINALPVLLLSLWQLGRVPAILNFSTGQATMLACGQLAGLRQLITSRAVLMRLKLKKEAFTEAGIEVICLEDFRKEISPAKKLRAYLRHRLFPPVRPQVPVGGEQTALVLFTSGSEGVPKGVELTHANVLANIRQMLAVTDITENDRLFNALPLFHSFGLTVGTLLPLVRGLFVFLFVSPLQYRLVPTLLYHTDCTIFLSTNTFLNGYARKAHPYDFRSLRYLFAAAEKLQESTAAHWSQRFGVRVLEGYGATECAPCVSVNTPLSPRPGSVGRVMPGMETKLVPVEGVEEGGRLLVRGPNIMRGYLNREANVAFQELEGWYDTGDIVRIDAEGYLYVLGRLKRFAKVSGEMVSLTAVEEILAGAFPQYGLRFQVAVVARPDEEKGEALIAVTNEPKLRLEEIRAAIQARGLTNLFVPREVKVVREIPKLGTGKINHRELQKML